MNEDVTATWEMLRRAARDTVDYLRADGRQTLPADVAALVLAAFPELDRPSYAPALERYVRELLDELPTDPGRVGPRPPSGWTR